MTDIQEIIKERESRISGLKAQFASNLHRKLQRCADYALQATPEKIEWAMNDMERLLLESKSMMLEITLSEKDLKKLKSYQSVKM